MLARLRSYLTTGLLVAGPLFVTVYLIWLVVTYVDDFMLDFIPDSLFGIDLTVYTPGLGILTTLIFLLFLGFFTVHVLGASLSSAVSYLVEQLPIVRAIYKLANQAFSLVLSNKLEAFGKVVMIETPRKGLWSLGFVCSQPGPKIADKLDEECSMVFVPTSPNPTSGFTMIVPKIDLIELEMSKEEAISIIISVGTIGSIKDNSTTNRKNPISEEEEKKLLLKNLSAMKSKIDRAREDISRVAAKHKRMNRLEAKLTQTKELAATTPLKKAKPRKRKI